MKVNKLLSSLVFPILLTGTISAQNTTTVTFKPGPAVGEDAVLFYTPNNCILTNYPGSSNIPAADQNWGNFKELAIDHWSMSSHSCDYVYRKILLRFTEIDNIPNNARVVSAKLKLITPPENHVSGFGNSFYPTSSFTNSNAGYIKLVSPGLTNAWEEMTATWNNTSSLTLNPSNEWITIPATNSRYNTETIIDITNYISKIIDDKNNQVTNYNNGFLLELKNYNNLFTSQYYASSDHDIANYHPELEVEYTLEESCDANFSITYNTNNINTYDFNANQPNARYEWTLNGQPINYNRSFSLMVKDKAEICLKVIMPETNETCSSCTKINNDITSINNLNIEEHLSIYPNPSSNYWNINIKNIKYNTANYKILDNLGRVVLQEVITNNQFIISNAMIPIGLYQIQIELDGFILNNKIIKN